MNKLIRVSTPSRLCLFGEHQDYLNLEVIAAAINLRFFAAISPRQDQLVKILIRDSRLDRLDSVNDQGLYEEIIIDLDQPIEYKEKRDYLRSTVQVLIRAGCRLSGYDIKLDSQIPIGKGMCSSSTMIVVLIKALLEAIDHPEKDHPEQIAEWAFQAEVAEFNEPGGKMDHFTSALGGLVHLDFSSGLTIRKLETKLQGCFILFDTLDQKDTTRVLSEAKKPAEEALEQLKPYGIQNIRDFISQPDKIKLLDQLDKKHRGKLQAQINNYRILQKGLSLLTSGQVNDRKLGMLISEHHEQLRDGLGISTAKIDSILERAISLGAYGGKINGSGGGGCCFVYAHRQYAENIIKAAEDMGYPARILEQDTGVRKDDAHAF